MALLRILNGSLENQEIELSPDSMTVGRASACNIRCRRRRLLQAREDLVRGRAVLPHGPGSTNGTFVNDRTSTASSSTTAT